MDPLVKAYLAEIGSIGGKIGGRVSSPAKTRACRRNARLPRPGARKEKTVMPLVAGEVVAVVPADPGV